MVNELKKKIIIFDFDDCLVKTSAKIKVNDTLTGKSYTITPEEFNNFKREKHLDLDFSEFNDIQILSDGIIIDEVFELLKKSIASKKAVGIITARESHSLIKNFLLSHGIDVNSKFIYTVGGVDSKYVGTVPERKKMAFKELMDLGFNEFIFYDDDLGNLVMANKLPKEFNIKMKTVYIKHYGNVTKIKG
jgi:FMN phosphatase YigB (HAD superfamily)